MSGDLGTRYGIPVLVNVDNIKFVLFFSNESLAHVSQSPWITNSTIRDNILFGRAMRARRYRRVLTACALHADLGVHTARDQAPASVLSGGQRQRVALARALYSHAGVLILDDPFAALDHTVAQKVFEKGIRRACERDNRTVVMVTHKLQLLAQADQVSFYIIYVLKTFINRKITTTRAIEYFMLCYDGWV